MSGKCTVAQIHAQAHTDNDIHEHVDTCDVRNLKINQAFISVSLRTARVLPVNEVSFSVQIYSSLLLHMHNVLILIDILNYTQSIRPFDLFAFFICIPFFVSFLLNWLVNVLFVSLIISWLNGAIESSYDSFVRCLKVYITLLLILLKSFLAWKCSGCWLKY